MGVKQETCVVRKDGKVPFEYTRVSKIKINVSTGHYIHKIDSKTATPHYDTCIKKNHMKCNLGRYTKNQIENAFSTIYVTNKGLEGDILTLEIASSFNPNCDYVKKYASTDKILDFLKKDHRSLFNDKKFIRGKAYDGIYGDVPRPTIEFENINPTKFTKYNFPGDF